MTDRKSELLRRAGKDPVSFDKRPLSEIMNDEVPYRVWAEEWEWLTSQGYTSWQHFLADEGKG